MKALVTICAIIAVSALAGCANQNAGAGGPSSPAINPSAIAAVTSSNDKSLDYIAALPQAQRQSYIQANPAVRNELLHSPNVQQRMKFLQEMSQH